MRILRRLGWELYLDQGEWTAARQYCHADRVSRETGARYKQIYVREPRQILLASSTPQFALARRSQTPLGR